MNSKANNMSKIVLFDMDGTILDSMPTWQEEGYKMLKENNIPGAAELAAKFSSMSALDIANYVSATGGEKSNERGLAILKEWRNKVLDKYKTSIVTKNGIEEVLQKYKKLNYRLVITTGTPLVIARQALEKNNLLKYFDALYDEGSIGIGKKDPKFFEVVLAKEKYDYKDAIVLDDSYFVLKAAKSLGIKTIGIYDVVSDALQKEVKEYSDIYVVCLKDLVDKID